MKKLYSLFITLYFFHLWDLNPRPLDYEATALPTELLCLSTSQGVKTYLFKVFASLRNLKIFTSTLSASRAGKPSKPRTAERDANGNLSFLHRLQVVSVPLLTGGVIGER